MKKTKTNYFESELLLKSGAWNMEYNNKDSEN